MLNRIVDQMDLGKSSQTCQLTGTGLGLAWQEAAGWVHGRFWN